VHNFRNDTAILKALETPLLTMFTEIHEQH